MTPLTILISAAFAIWLWPIIAQVGFDPRVNPLGNLDDETALGACICAGWLLIVAVSIFLLVIA